MIPGIVGATVIHITDGVILVTVGDIQVMVGVIIRLITRVIRFIQYIHPEVMVTLNMDKEGLPEQLLFEMISEVPLVLQQVQLEIKAHHRKMQIRLTAPLTVEGLLQFQELVMLQTDQAIQLDPNQPTMEMY